MTALLPQQILRGRRNACLVALGAGVLSVVGACFNRPQFFHSWLVAWVFFTGISCGALVIVMMQFLTGGDWGFAVQRLAEAGMLTLPLMALLFVPVLIGIHDVFPWSNADAPGATSISPHNLGYLNLPFFAVRGFFYFAALSALALSIRHWSVRQDRAAGSWLPGKRMRALSGGGLVIYVLCMNFASTDWIVSLEPDWYSTILVVIFMAGHFLSALALMTALLALFADQEPFATVVKTKHFHDLGNLLLTFVIFWTYVSFSQFLIIWSGNLPKEIAWYLHRTQGGWKEVAIILMMFQFVLPVALLLQRGMKRKRGRLTAIAMTILILNAMNVYWLIAPAFHPEGVRIHWLDFATLIAIGAAWAATFLWHLSRQPLLPLHPEEELRHA